MSTNQNDIEILAKSNAFMKTVSYYPSNMTPDGYYDLIMEGGDGCLSGVVLWEPFENYSLEELQEQLESEFDFLMDFSERVKSLTKPDSTNIEKVHVIITELDGIPEDLWAFKNEIDAGSKYLEVVNDRADEGEPITDLDEAFKYTRDNWEAVQARYFSLDVTEFSRKAPEKSSGKLCIN